jgi:hypothetical protein
MVQNDLAVLDHADLRCGAAALMLPFDQLDEATGTLFGH